MMEQDNKKRVLLLTCGTNACFHIAKVLKEKYGDYFYIVGTDINKRWMIPTTCYLDAYYTSPLSKSPEYYQFILNICAEAKIDFLIPLYDADQLLFYRDNPDLKSMGVVSFGIDSKWLSIYCSKGRTNDFLKTNGIVVPREFKVSEIDPTQDYFVKPVQGNGSIGARKANGAEIINTDMSGYVIQELCNEPEVTVECVCYRGKISAVARERLASKAGVCTKARVHNNEELNAIIERLSCIIPLPFLFNIQFMKGKNDNWIITDVNLRAAGGMGLSYAAGWDAVTAMAKIMLNEDDITSTLKVPDGDVFVVRSNADFVTKVAKRRIGFDLDGTLLDSRQRHVDVLEEVLKQECIRIDISDYMDYKTEGHSTKDFLLLKGIDKETSERINKKWIELIEEERFLASDNLYPGTLKMLSDLSFDSSLYIITARNNRDNAYKQIKDLGIQQYFEGVYVVESSKNTSQIKADVMKKKGINVFYGDTESDYEAASVAGCDFKAVTGGFRSDSFWRKYNVEQINLKKLKY